MSSTAFSTQSHIHTVVFTPKLTFTTRALLHKSTLGGQEAAQDSDVAGIL